MALNSSNASHPFPVSSYFSVYEFIFHCFWSTIGIYSMTVYTIIISLLLPIYVLIIYLVHQRWQCQHLSTTMSNSDLITYQVAIIELLNIVGCIFCCCGIYAGITELIAIGAHFFPVKLTGELMFHTLTCMENYLAVVHPITYLGLRTANKIRIRNITYGCVWILSALSVASMSIVDELCLLIMGCSIIFPSVLFIGFFSISVLCALIQSKPRKDVGHRQRLHQTKLRAFYTIISILGLLLLRTGGYFLTLFKSNSLDNKSSIKCGLWLSVFWFCLPSSLVLPFIFLHKAEKLSCFNKSKNSP